MMLSRLLLLVTVLTPGALGKDLQYDGPVTQLESEGAVTEAAANSDAIAIIEFYAPWCPHCQHFAPTYGRLATQYKNESLVNLFAVNCEDHADVCTANGVEGYPTIKAFVQKVNVSKYGGDQTISNLTGWISQTMKDNGLTPPVVDAEELTPAPEWQKVKGKTIISPSPVRRMDLAATLFNAFDQMVGQIPDGQNMPVEKTKALQSWLHRLSTIPDLTAPLKPMLLSTTTGLASKSSLSTLIGRSAAPGISKAALKSALENLQVFGFRYGSKYSTLRGQDEEWSACAGPGHGYPCGLWQLLHTLTVYSDGGLASTRAASSTYPSPDQKKNDAQQVLIDIRQFIANFFPCEQCRSHFLTEVGTPDGEVVRSISSREDVVLWLWRTHNKVSKRLAPEWGVNGDLVIYPPKSACKECRQTALAETQGWKWDTSKVLGFLDHTFSLEGATRPSSSKGTTLLTLLRAKKI